MIEYRHLDKIGNDINSPTSTTTVKHFPSSCVKQKPVSATRSKMIFFLIMGRNIILKKLFN
jgi:hypothetical protein